MYKLFGKRILDVVVSLVMICVCLPLLLGACVVVFLGDGFPILYSQNRVGRNAREFSVYKFRTMKQGMESLGFTTKEDDPRFFWGSKFLRVFKVDELPQLINVLLGDMSLVGPRPTVYEDYARMSPGQKNRVNVRPGLTGLAQISGNTSLTWPDRIEYDLKYVSEVSLCRDIKILFKTAVKWVSNKLDSTPPETGEW